MRVAIVTFYDNKERYILAGNRQRQSLMDVNFPMDDYYQFRNYAEIDSPTHQKLPYAFKVKSIDKVRKMGYDIVIWFDSAIYAVKDFTHFIDHVKQNGNAFFDNIGFTIGSYTNDICLKKMRMARKTANQHPMIMACLMAFNFKDKKCKKMFKQFYDSAIPECFDGDWADHRHDQSAMSIILAKNKVKPLHPNNTFFAYTNHPGHLPHADTLCFLSQGY
jgi:hypothetical protein